MNRVMFRKNPYEEIYSFVNRLFTTHENNFQRLRKDLRIFLSIKHGIEISDKERCVLSEHLMNLGNNNDYNAHLIIINKEISEKNDLHQIMSETFISLDGEIQLLILIPEKYIMTGMSIEERFKSFQTMFSYFLSLYNYNLPVEFNNSFQLTDFIIIDAPIHMAAQLLVDNKISMKEELPKIIEDWEEVFRLDLYSRLAYQMELIDKY